MKAGKKVRVRLEISHVAHRQIEDLSPRIARRINEAIAGLANEPRPVGAKKLIGIEGCRIRLGIIESYMQ